MTTALSTDGKYTVFCIGLSTSEATPPIELGGYGGVMGSVQVIDGGGTGLNAGTLTIQVSNDGVNWHTLADLAAADITYTDGDEGKVKEFSTAAKYIRALNDGTVSDADVHFCFRG